MEEHRVKNMESACFREFWAENRSEKRPDGKLRLRVNDRVVSLDPEFGHRPEARANGLMLLEIDEELFHVAEAELFLELWGGHPGTRGARFILNGRRVYRIPEAGTSSGACTYTYPVIPIQIGDLVRGVNAFQFVCDRGKAMWGHLIVDNACVRLYLDRESLSAAEPALSLEPLYLNVSELPDREALRLGIEQIPDSSVADALESVEYFGFYHGFDDTGSGRSRSWHGFTQNRQWRNHIGSATSPPFAAVWDTRMVPDQRASMLVRALLHYRSGFHRWSRVSRGIVLPARRERVKLLFLKGLPKPFWSRMGRRLGGDFVLSVAPNRIRKSELLVKIWDGGEGSIRDPFTLNGHAYRIVTGRAIHDVVFARADVAIEHLRRGANKVEVVSDTEHHGIEVLLPGPCLVIRYR
jgi:hypothetical protein